MKFKLKKDMTTIEIRPDGACDAFALGQLSQTIDCTLTFMRITPGGPEPEIVLEANLQALVSKAASNKSRPPRPS